MNLVRSLHDGLHATGSRRLHVRQGRRLGLASGTLSNGVLTELSELRDLLIKGIDELGIVPRILLGCIRLKRCLTLRNNILHNSTLRLQLKGALSTSYVDLLDMHKRTEGEVRVLDDLPVQDFLRVDGLAISINLEGVRARIG